MFDEVACEPVQQFGAPRPGVHLVGVGDDAVAEQTLPDPVHQGAGQAAVAFVAGFAGVLLIVRPGSGLAPLGVALALVNAAFATGYHLLTRYLVRSESTSAMLYQAALVGSVLFCLGGDVGEPEGSGIDIGDAPLDLRAGDRLLIASDGIFTLTEPQLKAALAAADARTAVEAVLRQVIEIGDRMQDNCTVVVVEVLDPEA